MDKMKVPRKAVSWYRESGLNWVFSKCFQWIQFQEFVEKVIQICISSCKKRRCYHRASKTQLTEEIFRLAPVHASMEFFLNVFTAVTKRARTYHLLCKRPWCYHSVSKTQARDNSFKLTRFMIHWFISFPEFAEITEFPLHLEKNSTLLHGLNFILFRFFIQKLVHTNGEYPEESEHVPFPEGKLSVFILQGWTF